MENITLSLHGVMDILLRFHTMYNHLVDPKTVYHIMDYFTHVKQILNLSCHGNMQQKKCVPEISEVLHQFKVTILDIFFSQAM